jgi:hypothetical protein
VTYCQVVACSWRIGRQLGKRLPFTPVDEGKQGLLPAVQLAPARADLSAVTADDPGRVGQRGTRQRQRGTLGKALGALGGRRIVVIASSTRGFAIARLRHAVRHKRKRQAAPRLR